MVGGRRGRKEKGKAKCSVQTWWCVFPLLPQNRTGTTMSVSVPEKRRVGERSWITESRAFCPVCLFREACQPTSGEKVVQWEVCVCRVWGWGWGRGWVCGGQGMHATCVEIRQRSMRHERHSEEALGKSVKLHRRGREGGGGKGKWEPPIQLS